MTLNSLFLKTQPFYDTICEIVLVCYSILTIKNLKRFAALPVFCYLCTA